MRKKATFQKAFLGSSHNIEDSTDLTLVHDVLDHARNESFDDELPYGSLCDGLIPDERVCTVFEERRGECY